ncbi:MAG: 30S ribosomal protein S7 [Firmicutes bacterium]|nr:30S ribosomal protein S7 [Bacillota bacterium]
MPRRGTPPRREITPDLVHSNRLVTQLTNQVLCDGKKGIAEKAVYDAFDIIQDKTGSEPLVVFKKAMDNIKPVLEVKPRRVGGATYQVPMEVRVTRRTSLAVRWIVNYARARGERTMEQRLAAELIDASQGAGGAVKKRDETHRMAESNKAFAHYRW